MTEVRFDGGEVRRVGRSAWTGRLRRPLLLFAVMILCGVAYLGGVWYGMQGGMTCTVMSPGLIQCGTDADAPPPPQQPAPSQAGSA
jgi:hypothetical protein